MMPTDEMPTPARRVPAEVVLLSAGPGALDLLTLRAVRELEAADVLLVDELVDPAIAGFAPDARLIRVGKRGGCRSTPQAFICRLMRRYALRGLKVARVKGGDALLFGRAGEEIAFLRASGIEVRIVNGVSAGFAAAASLGVSLTHRDHCHGITFVTAHTHDHGEPDWAALAATGTTLAIYMGMRRAGALGAALRRHLPAATPVAIVQSASRPDELRWLTTLAGLEDVADVLDPGAPGVIFVGEAVGEASGRLPRPAVAARADADLREEALAFA